MPSALAIVSKAVFEKAFGASASLGAVLPLDGYDSKHATLTALTGGGDLYLVTVRPGERLWLVGVLRAPTFTGERWQAAKNAVPVVDATALVSALRFSTGSGIKAAPGKLGMSLQTPRVLADADVALLAPLCTGSVAGAAPALEAQPAPKARAAPAPRREPPAAKTTTITRSADPLASLPMLMATDPHAALSSLLALWRENRWVRLAPLIESLSKTVESEAAKNLRDATKVAHDAWMTFASKAPVADRGALASAAPLGTSKEVRERFATMFGWDDPRVSGVALSLVPKPIWTSTGASPVWTAIYKLLEKNPDPRLLTVVRSMPHVDERLQKVVAIATASWPSGEVEASAESGVAALEATLQIAPSGSPRAQRPRGTVRQTPLPSTSLAATVPMAVDLPVALERRGDKTLYGLLPELVDKRPRRFERLTIMSDAGHAVWGAAVAQGVAALSPSGTWVALLAGQPAAPGAPGAVQTRAGWEQVVLTCERLDLQQPPVVSAPLQSAPPPSLRAASADKPPWAYRSAVRSVAFVDEVKVAVLLGIEPADRFDRERMLLWLFDLSTQSWELLHDERDVDIDALRMFRTEDGCLVAHGRDLPQHSDAQVRVFVALQGRLRLRQAYAQPDSEPTELQRIDPGGWFIVHPTAGFVLQRFSRKPYSSEILESQVVHVDARTGAQTLLGPIAGNERALVTRSGQVMAYGSPQWGTARGEAPKGKRVEIVLRALAEPQGTLELPRPHLVDHLAPGLLAVATRGEAHVVDVERRQVTSTRAVATPVVDDLSASTDGQVVVAQRGTMALVQTDSSSKLRSVGSAKGARLFATGSGLVVGVAGRALTLEGATGTSVATTKTEGVLMGGLLSRAGAVVVDGASVTRLVLEGTRLVVGARRDVGAAIECVHASPDGEALAVGTGDGRVLLFLGDQAAPSSAAQIADGAVTQLALHADGARVLSLCSGKVRLDDLSSGASAVVAHPHQGTWAGLAAHPAAPWAAFVDDAGEVFLFHTESQALARVGSHHRGTHRLVLVDDTLLVGGGLRGPDAPSASVVRYALGRSA